MLGEVAAMVERAIAQRKHNGYQKTEKSRICIPLIENFWLSKTKTLLEQSTKRDAFAQHFVLKVIRAVAPSVKARQTIDELSAYIGGRNKREGIKSHGRKKGGGATSS
jgi:hypothetical protein